MIALYKSSLVVSSVASRWRVSSSSASCVGVERDEVDPPAKRIASSTSTMMKAEVDKKER